MEGNCAGTVSGVNMLLSPAYYLCMAQMGAVSPDGALETFDRRANGIVLGEGVGALRPLGAPKALAAGHRRLFLDVGLWKLGEEAARDRAGPLAVDAAVGGVEDSTSTPGAGNRHIGEAALLLQ